MLQGLLEDVRYGLRVLRGNPGPTAVAVLTLALGIAANTAVFGWINILLLHPVPGAGGSSELAAIETITPAGEFNVSSLKDYRDYRDRSTQTTGMAASLMNAFTLGEDHQPERVWGEVVTANYFTVLQVRTTLGRAFQPSDFGDHAGSAPYLVISHRLWRTRFNADPAVIGKTLRLNSTPMTILGVADAGFGGAVPGISLDLWVPIVMAPALNGQGDWLLEDRGQRQFWITARLKPGVTHDRASAEIASIARQIAQENPRYSTKFSAALFPIWRAHMGGQGLLLRPLQILMAVCAILFLIVAANVANIQLARAMAREKEFSIRLAIGAGQKRLFRQLLTESLLLALAGGAAGVLLCLWMGDSLTRLLPPLNLPLDLQFTLNYEILGFTLALCVSAAVLSGLAPALLATRRRISESLKDTASATTGRHVHRTRGILVVSEVALAAVALIGTGLFVESFRQARALALGFEAERVVLGQFHVATFCRNAQDRAAFITRMSAHLKTVPGVERVSFSDAIPLALGNHPWSEVEVEGYMPARGEDMRVASNEVGPGFLATLGIPLLEGRDISEADTPATLPVVVVNEAFTRRFLAGRNPIGARMRMRGRLYTIIGVARNHRFGAITDAPRPYFYYAYNQVGGGHFWYAFFIRTVAAPPSMIASLRREVASVNPAAAVADLMPYDQYIGGALYPHKVAATLVSGMGIVALFLAAVGLYGVLSFAVAQRRREFGIRMAMGARQSQVLFLVIRQGLRLVTLGVLAGLVLALIVARPAAPLLVGVTPADPMILGGAAGLLALVAVIATCIPARSATRVDPVVALRQQ